jgi:hypothetical protein
MKPWFHETMVSNHGFMVSSLSRRLSVFLLDFTQADVGNGATDRRHKTQLHHWACFIDDPRLYT